MAQVCERLVGDVDGSNVEFQSSQIPEWGSLRVFVDGIETRVESINETTITLSEAPASGVVLAVYNVRENAPTALDIIADALMEIGVLGSDSPEPDHGDAQLALRYLNRLIESNNILREAVYCIEKTDLTLTALQQEYTIGIDPAGIQTADFNIERPTRIESIVLQMNSVGTIVRDEPMLALSDEDWARKRVTQVYAIPKEYHYEPSYPLGVIQFYPAPASAYVIELRAWHQIAKISTLYDTVLVPPGYREYMLYQLAMRLCGPFARPIPAHLPEMERRAYSAVQALNVAPPMVETDPMLLHGSHDAFFNWMKGPAVK